MKTVIRKSYKPKLGDYCNTLVVDDETGNQYLFDGDGVWTLISTDEEGIVAEAVAQANAYTDDVAEGKVDKEEGKGLSENDFTDEDKDKLDSVEAGAQENVIEVVKRNGVALPVVDKTVDVSVPTTTSALTNDSGYITNAVDDLVNYYDKDETDTIVETEALTRDAADQDLQEQIDAIVASSDVVDIVGTYAELQNYDTSKLHDNDIIKVLTDETRDDATTYYRWDDDTDTFSYIGSEGPYYTKGEADATFVPLTRTINGKGLNSDVVLTAADVGALPSSTVIPTVNDATLTIQKNGSTVQTFTANQATNATANITVPTKTSDLTNDGSDNTSTYVESDELATVATSGSYNDLTDKPTIDFELVEMSYGESNAWAKFIDAYRGHKIVYCRASSNSNPATGTQGRKAFMAYVNNAENPTEVEFQYVRSVSTKTASQPVDQVYIYKLTNANGGTWTVQTRNMAPKLAQGTNTTVSYSNGTYTVSATQPTVNDATLTIKKNGSSVGTFTANSSTNTDVDITVPTKTSDLTNDSGFIDKNVSDLTNYYDETTVNSMFNALTIPTKTSDLTNDSGFITNTDYASASTGGVVKVGSGLSIDANGVLSSNGLTSVDWSDVTNKPTNVSYWTNDAGYITSAAVPTKTSDLTNDSGFITSASLPTKTSDLTNDSGFITSSVNNLANYYKKSETYTQGEVNSLINAIAIPTKTSDLTNDGSDGTSTYVEADDLATVATSGSYNDLSNRPTIGNATLTIQKNGTNVQTFTANATSNKTANITVPTKTSDLTNDSDFVSNTDYATASTGGVVKVGSGLEITNGVLSATGGGTADAVEWDNVLNKPTFSTVATSGSYNDLTDKPTIPTVNNATLTIQRNSTNVGTFTANASSNKTINITVPTTAADVSALPASTKYGASIEVTIDPSDYKVTTTLKDQDGNRLGAAQTIDLPLESVVVNGSYDSTNKKIVLTLQNGNTIDIPVGDLIAGLQTEITSTNKLSSDLVDDTNHTHKFVTAAQITKLNGIAAGAEVNVQSDWNVTDSSSDAFIKNKPTIPTVNNGTLTIQKNGTNVQTFTANQSGNATANITVPTKTSDITNDSGFITTSALSGYLPLTGGTLTGKLTGTQIETGTATDNYFQTQKFRGQGDASSYYHAIDFGYGGHNQVDFYEYGGVWNFWRNTSATATTDTNNLALGITLNALKNKSYTYTFPDKTGTFALTSDIPAAQVNSDWNATSGKAQILNKPSLATVATSGSYNDLSNKPTIPAAQVQSNWTQTTTTAVDYIKNKPTLATVATSGSYNDLSNKPTIPTVNNATLTIQKNGSTVKTFTANASSNVTANITVPTNTNELTNGAGFITSSGTAAKANQLTTARTIALSGGATGTATSFDGTSNITIPITDVKDAYVTWGGKNIVGNITPDDMGCIDEFGHNKLAFLSADCIEVKYSTDGGSSWVDYGLTDAQKVKMVSTTGTGIYVGGPTDNATSSNITNLKLRVRIAAGPTSGGKIYTAAKKILINMSNQGAAGSKVDIRYRTIANYKAGTETWVNVGTFDLSGGSGWNSIPFNYTFGGSFSTQTSQMGQIEFVLYCTGLGTWGLKKPDFIDFRLIGSTNWTMPSEMARAGHLYTVDENQNATFPANVSVTGSLKHGNYTYTLPSKNGTVAMTSDIPSVPTVNNGQLTIQKNGSNVATFTANQSGNATANITVPTKTSDLTNDSGFVNSTAIAGKQDLLTAGAHINITGTTIKAADYVHSEQPVATSSVTPVVTGNMISNGTITADKLASGATVKLTLSTSDIGEGAALAANTLYGVYQ